MKQKILLLEDDANLGFVLREHLESNGFQVTLQPDGERGLEEVARARFDMCLVDVMMPKKDGFTFAKELRSRDVETPIIFLTAKAMKEDRVEGFTIGGDDYVTKPFSMEELLLRIRAVLKRTSSPKTTTGKRSPVALGGFAFDGERQTLSRRGHKQKLTAKEAQLLLYLVDRRNKVVERSEILKAVWGEDTYFNGRSLDVFVSRLRKYLAADKSVEIKNVHSRGFKLLVP